MSGETSHVSLTLSESSDDEVDLVCRITEGSLVSEHVTREGIEDLSDYSSIQTMSIKAVFRERYQLLLRMLKYLSL